MWVEYPLIIKDVSRIWYLPLKFPLGKKPLPRNGGIPGGAPLPKGGLKNGSIICGGPIICGGIICACCCGPSAKSKLSLKSDDISLRVNDEYDEDL